MTNKENKSTITKKSIALIIMLTIMLISVVTAVTLVYFTDRQQQNSTLSFGKIELTENSAATTFNVNASYLPGQEVINNANPIVAQMKNDSSEAYIRARVYFTHEYVGDAATVALFDEYISVLNNSVNYNSTAGYQWTQIGTTGWVALTTTQDTTHFMATTKTGDAHDAYTVLSSFVMPTNLTKIGNNLQATQNIIKMNIAVQAIQTGMEDTTLESVNEKFELI